MSMHLISSRTWSSTGSGTLMETRCLVISFISFHAMIYSVIRWYFNARSWAAEEDMCDLSGRNWRKWGGWLHLQRKVPHRMPGEVEKNKPNLPSVQESHWHVMNILWYCFVNFLLFYVKSKSLLNLFSPYFDDFQLKMKC